MTEIGPSGEHAPDPCRERTTTANGRHGVRVRKCFCRQCRREWVWNQKLMAWLLLLHCRQCRSSDLALLEVMHELARWDEGLYLDEHGSIRPLGDAVRSPGEIQPQLTEIECLNCGHTWRPQRRFAGPDLTS
jgi:hypothetical protein